MSEIRKHYFLDEYCIISPGRYKRPSDFAHQEKESNTKNCFFCAGNEDQTPPSTAVYKKGEILKDTEESLVKGWDVRCIPNLYPALTPEPENIPQSMWNSSEGFGYHEVIVETPDHEMTISGFPDKQMSLLMKVYRDRCTYYESQEGVEYASLFKNWGSRAGASLEHAHSQLIALPFIPPMIKREQEAIHNSDECPYCEIVEKERKSERLLYENNDFIAIAPYFSTALFEIWILPKQHVNHLGECSEGMLKSLGDAVKFVVSRYEERLGSPSYNYMFHQITGDEKYHLNLRVQPVITTLGGFEKNTDVHINTVTPEYAAQCLKGDID